MMKKSIINLLAMMLATVLSLTASAQTSMEIPMDQAVRYGVLENGLTYYIRHNAKPEQRVEFYIAQKVGSIQEQPEQRGLAHFLEHMAFNGTKNFPGDGTAPGIVEWCEQHAIKFGTNLNAYTSVDETVYNISNVPTTKESVLDSCLLILSDWSSNILLSDKDIDDERGVISEEWRSRNSGIMRVYTDAQSTMYPDSKYADCMPIGSIDVIRNFPYKAIRDYYNTWYHTGNQGIIIVGDIDAEKMEEKVKALFSQIPKRQGAPERIYYQVPDNKEPLIYIGSDKEVSDPMIQIYFKHDADSREDKKSLNYLVSNYALSMISSMLNTRLAEMLQVSEPPFAAAQAVYDDYFLSNTKSAFNVAATSAQDGIEKALKALLEEIERMRRYGFTQGEYQRASANYMQMIESAYNERANIQHASYVNEYVRHFLDGEPTPGIEYEYAIMSQIIPSIPLEAINQLAMEQLITEENIAVLIAVPDAVLDITPDKQKVLGMLEGMSNLKVEPYEDTLSDEPLIAELPKPGTIIKESAAQFGTTLLELSNGVKVYLKKTDFKDDEIILEGTSKGGTSLYASSELLNLNQLSSVATVGGLGNFSSVDLGKVLAGKKASISVDVSGTYETISGNSSVRDLETLLQLVYLSFTSPRKDTEAFASYKTRLKAALENQKADPLSSINDSISKAMYGDHERILYMQPEMVDDIDYDRILELYKERFSDASDFEFFMVGNIDMESVKPLLCQYLGSLPSKGVKEQPVDHKQYILPGIRLMEYEKKQQTPMATVIMIYSGDVAYNPGNLLKMSILSQTLDMLFTSEIREKEGGTYGVSTSGAVRHFPKQFGIMQIVYQTDPQRKDDLNEKIFKLMEEMAAKGPDEAYLQNAKDYMIKSHEDNLKENVYWLGLLDTYFDSGLDLDKDYESIVRGITRSDIQKFCKALLSQGNRTTVIMTDNSK